MTFIEKFEEIKKLGETPVQFEKEFAIQIDMTDDDCKGSFYAAFKNGVFSVEPYTYNDRDALMTIKSDVLVKLLQGDIDPVASFLTGKFKIDGSVEAVLELTKLCAANKAKKKAEKKAAKKSVKGEVKQLEFDI